MTNPSPRETFNRQLDLLMESVLVQGSMVEQAILRAVQALEHKDVKTAALIYEEDEKINQKRYEIEAETLRLIATQQPMARDLRFLAAVLEINTELERIGDYAKGIARITILIGDSSMAIPATDLQRMAELGLSMLHRALGAFVERDVFVAESIPREDDEVDDLYNCIHRELIQQVIVDPSRVDDANHIMWAAHNLERMADRVTNICERIVFMVTGEMKEMDVSTDEYQRMVSEK